jgi:GH43 family beta-xylosidase
VSIRSAYVRAPRLSRRALLLGTGGLALGAAVAGGPAGVAAIGAGHGARRSSLDRVVNPLVFQRADPKVIRHTDGRYFMTASVPEYDRIAVRGAATIAGLADAEEVVVWRRPESGPMGGHIWAPEIHHLDGRWYIYFAAGDSDDVFRIRTYAIVSPSRDPRSRRWSEPIRMDTGWDTFTLDATVFEHRGTRYFAWAQHEPGIDTNSNLYLAPMASPLELAAAPARLAVPTLPWEIRGFRVNEGPAVIVRNGRVFMTYSASATDARYAMGILTADADAELMNPASWTKSPEPIFTTNEATSMYGPGHNSFTVDERGRDVLVFHARDYREIEGDPLYDPNRHTRVQRLYWNPDGTPSFGIPVGNGPLPYRLEPADRLGRYVHHLADQVVVGTPGRLETSQFRLRPGLAGWHTTSFEPIDAPGRYLRRLDDGRVVLATPDGSHDFCVDASFVRRPGLADPRATSWRAVGTLFHFLRHAAGALRVERLDHGGRESATFYLD